MNNTNSLIDQVNYSVEAAKADLDHHKAELEAAQARYNEARSRYDDAMQNFLESDLLRVCRWNQMYHKLIQWKEEHDGDTLVPTKKDSSEDEKKLAKWCQNQRVFYKYFLNGDTKHIKQHRITALDKIGFVWNVFEHQWNANFEELKQYYAEKKTFDVPKRENPKLAAFVLTMRSAMKKRNEGIVVQKNTTLTEERINKLNSINFHWGFKRPPRTKSVAAMNMHTDYDQFYQLLASFKEEYGHLYVSKMLQEWIKGVSEPSNKEYKRLSVFVTAIKKEHDAYREGKPSVLTEERVEQLTALGIKWKKPPNEPRKSTSTNEDDPNRETRKRRKIGEEGGEEGDRSEDAFVEAREYLEEYPNESEYNV
mmetsp:Transcript_24956/g.39189  ORF Transcript_24956/g.39189 Transcript_24956/m.39189 type:complete len:366 (-) Transcript_24956:85-1182(-)|eukprot:CAMPEP_0201719604 /NCGR_PEP_ID=MMETSP0593-20130828/4781_1 /ASSEMBLY_ACC=CAM_ASM_000672 /TAXON_ID=267983 /ORGANISM="Skeletonema japonicum, Strain CCMP2506" /LENGTH=365 /DNA_ID=CAMNT_0048210087 /DNA_START=52 /DNA_END=1149 /DNA_ORIENTATION=+